MILQIKHTDTHRFTCTVKHTQTQTIWKSLCKQTLVWWSDSDSFSRLSSLSLLSVSSTGCQIIASFLHFWRENETIPWEHSSRAGLCSPERQTFAKTLASDPGNGQAHFIPTLHWPGARNSPTIGWGVLIQLSYNVLAILTSKSNSPLIVQPVILLHQNHCQFLDLQGLIPNQRMLSLFIPRYCLIASPLFTHHVPQ